MGVPVGLIDGRLRSGRLVAVHAGVYAVGPRRDDALARAAAAVLACGPTAVLSHVSAASLWGLRRYWVFPLEVTAQSDRKRPGIRTHQSTTLAAADRRRHLGIWVTSPARTVLDIAPTTHGRQLTRMVNDARRAGLLSLAQMTDLLERCPRAPGVRYLRPFVELPMNPTRSGFEDDFQTFCRRFGLPMASVNTSVNGREADAVFEAEKLIVEVDGWDFHNDRTAFADDRERDAEALRAGYATIRITSDRLTDTPDREAERLWEILRARRPAGGAAPAS